MHNKTVSTKSSWKKKRIENIQIGTRLKFNSPRRSHSCLLRLSFRRRPCLPNQEFAPPSSPVCCCLARRNAASIPVIGNTAKRIVHDIFNLHVEAPIKKTGSVVSSNYKVTPSPPIFHQVSANIKPFMRPIMRVWRITKNIERKAKATLASRELANNFAALSNLITPTLQAAFNKKLLKSVKLIDFKIYNIHAISQRKNWIKVIKPN